MITFASRFPPLGSVPGVLLQPWFHLGLCVEFAFDVRLSLCLAPLKDLNWRFRVDLIHAFGRIKLGRFRQRGVLTSGATSLVSLVERHELSAFGVTNLGEAAEEAGLEWHHLPIKDVHIPDERFERRWTYSGQVLRRRLQSGERIVLHCRGGLGRTGTIAARLAIELGETPETALRRVRAARKGAVETHEQEAYVLQKPFPVPDAGYTDRVLGCLLGGAVGDAFGYGVEFSKLPQIHQRFGPLQEPVLNRHGEAEVSDDTQMTLFTLEGLLAGIRPGAPIDQPRNKATSKRSSWQPGPAPRRHHGHPSETHEQEAPESRRTGVDGSRSA